MGKNALIVTAIDGLNTMQCGIGSMVNWFFESFPDICQSVPQLIDGDFHLHAVAPEIDKGSKDYSGDSYKIVNRACQATGGSVWEFPVSDNRSLKAIWSLAEPDSWIVMAMCAATLIRVLACQYERITVLVHGLMLTPLRAYLEGMGNVQVVFITHSLGRVFQDQQTDARSSYEEHAFHVMHRYPQDQIAYVSTYFRDILEQMYQIKKVDMLPMLNGIYKSSYRFTGRNSRINSYNFPENKKWIFSWGRCIAQKGFDLIIEAFGKLLTTNPDDYHLIILMPQSCAPINYIESIYEQLNQLKSDSFTAIPDFDDMLPRDIMASPSLELIVLASRFESFGLTAMEARFLAPENIRFVYTPIPTFVEIFANDLRALQADAISADALYEAMNQGLSQKTKEEQIVIPEIADFVVESSRSLSCILNFWKNENI